MSLNNYQYESTLDIKYRFGEKFDFVVAVKFYRRFARFDDAACFCRDKKDFYGAVFGDHVEKVFIKINY